MNQDQNNQNNRYHNLGNCKDLLHKVIIPDLQQQKKLHHLNNQWRKEETIDIAKENATKAKTPLRVSPGILTQYELYA